jgi:hypothetical protein
MTKEELEELKKTFPWTWKMNQGFVLTVYDRNNNVVDMIVMVKFLQLITTIMAKRNVSAN